MASDDFGHQRIQFPHQRASCLIVMLQRSLNQRACVRIIHVVEIVSTPLPMTANGALRLQVVSRSARAKRMSLVPALDTSASTINGTKKNCNRCSAHAVIIFESAMSAQGKEQTCI